LDLDDIEDCYLIFFIALGIKLGELLGVPGKAVGPQIIAFNVRKLLRTGLRKGLQKVLMKAGGQRLARKLTERAMMRLLVPGINVPIAYVFNSAFTKLVLRVADRKMRQRGRVVQPLVRLYKREPRLDKLFAVKVLISVVEAGDPEEWAEGQLDALRYCQGALSLSDDDLMKLETYFDREMGQVLSEGPSLSAKAATDLCELAMVISVLYPDDSHDLAYATAIRKISERSEKPSGVASIMLDIQKLRSGMGMK